MKRSKRLLSFALVLVIAFSVALSGCSGDKKSNSSGNQSNDSSGEPTYGGSVVVGIQQDIDSLDPHKATAAGTKEILFNIFEGLVKPDENGGLIKAVASDYSMSEDGRVYTFTLRDGIKFHNGNTVTAEDVKYSLERASGLLDGNVLITALKKISSVDIVDSRTVKVELASADTEMIYSFTAAIIPKPSDGADISSNPIGTGPFKFVSYTPQESIVVAKNEDYWQDGLPYLDEVKFKIIAGADTALLELKGGSVDMYPYLTDSQATELQDTYDIEYAISDVAQALFLNNAAAPFDNVKVRQAVACALNKDEINQFVAGGKSAVINSAMIPTMKDYYVDTTSYNSYNADRARQLLAEAGYPDGFDMTITVPSNYPFHMETAQVVAEQLKAVGINAKIDGVDWSTWLSEVYSKKNYQSTICALTADLAPSSLLVRFTSDYPNNFVNFSDEEYDRLYAEAEAATDTEVKKEKYRQLQQLFADKEGSVFIQAAVLLIAKNKQLAGYKFYPVYVQDMSTVYYIKAE